MPFVRVRTVSVLRGLWRRIWTEYMGKYEQESTTTLNVLNVIFTFKLTFKGLKVGPNLHSQDDVIWYSSYYKKWSSNYDLSAYKICTFEFGPVVPEISNKQKYLLCACALWVSCEVYDGIFIQNTWVSTKVQYDTKPFKRHLHLQNRS